MLLVYTTQPARVTTTSALAGYDIYAKHET